MGERGAKEQAAAAALHESTEALAGAALRATNIASDIAVGAGEAAADSLFDVLCSVTARVREAEMALAEWTRAASVPDGAHVDDYNRLTHGHRWHVVRGGVTTARGWAPTQDEAEAAAKAAWEMGEAPNGGGVTSASVWGRDDE